MPDIAPRNALLRSLLPGDFERLRPHIQLIDLHLSGVLYEMEDPASFVYFPEVGLLSIITVMGSGEAVETSIVGREGAVGFIETLGSGTMFSRVIVQLPGKAFRVRGQRYREAFDSSATMRKAVQRHTELLLATGRQAIACNCLHAIEPRFKRWLLECQDQAGGQTILPLKQEFLAVMLGVTRPSVTAVAVSSKKQGLIRYSRGSIEILDREGLERGACECRASVQHLRQRLEPQSTLVGGES